MRRLLILEPEILLESFSVQEETATYQFVRASIWNTQAVDSTVSLELLGLSRYL